MKSTVVILLAAVIAMLVWNTVQVHNMYSVLRKTAEKIDESAVGQKHNSTAGAAGGHNNLTVNMWQIFEKELQDYKQRLREGKQQYDSQQASWNEVLTNLKKNLQEYDKFITAEGDFWEKQLKNYDKLLGMAGERFDALDMIIDDLRDAAYALKNRREEIRGSTKSAASEFTPPERVQKAPAGQTQRIVPKIEGRGGRYKTYPSAAEEEKQDAEKEEGIGENIRGTVTGSGTYHTY